MIWLVFPAVLLLLHFSYTKLKKAFLPVDRLDKYFLFFLSFAIAFSAVIIVFLTAKFLQYNFNQ